MRVVLCAFLLLSVIAGASAAYNAEVNVTQFIPSGQDWAVYNSPCYDPSDTTNLVVQGGVRFIYSVNFTRSANVLAIKFFFYLGVDCKAVPSVSANVLASILGQDNSQQPSYTLWNLTFTKFEATFSNSIVLSGFQSSFSDCGFQLFTAKDVAVSGCTNFLASREACPFRQIGVKPQNDNAVVFGAFFDQKNINTGCSSANVDFAVIPALIRAADTTPPSLNVSINTTNAKSNRAKPGDVICVNVVASEALALAPTIFLYGAASSSGVVLTGTNTYASCFTTSSSTPISTVNDNVKIINYQDVNNNKGPDVTGTTSGTTVLFDSSSPILTYFRWNVDGVESRAFGTVNSLVEVFVLAAGVTYSTDSVKVTFADSSTQLLTLDTSTLLSTSGVRYFKQLASAPAGSTSVTIQNLYSPSGVNISPQTFSGKFSLVPVFPTLDVFAADGSSTAAVTASFSCSKAAKFFYVVLPFRIDDDRAKFCLNRTSSVYTSSSSITVGSSSFTINQVTCATSVSTFTVALTTIQPKIWYSIIYVTQDASDTSAVSPTPQLAIEFYTSKGYTCFPPSSSVVLSSGASVSLSALRVGDEVLSLSESGVTEFSPVVRVHKHVDAASVAFLEMSIQTEAEAEELTLRITPDHLLYKYSPLALSSPVAASSLKLGDAVYVNGKNGLTVGRVSFLNTVYETVALSPVTMNGRLFVDGVLVSSYGANGEFIGHLSHAVHRALYRVSPALLESSVVERAESVAEALYHRGVLAAATQILSH